MYLKNMNSCSCRILRCSCSIPHCKWIEGGMWSMIYTQQSLQLLQLFPMTLERFVFLILLLNYLLLDFTKLNFSSMYTPSSLMCSLDGISWLSMHRVVLFLFSLVLCCLGLMARMWNLSWFAWRKLFLYHDEATCASVLRVFSMVCMSFPEMCIWWLSAYIVKLEFFICFGTYSKVGGQMMTLVDILLTLPYMSWWLHLV